jgi:hypothetical protein
MFKQIAVGSALALALMIGPGTKTVSAQSAAKTEGDAQPDKSLNAYRLDFSVSELEDGKKINTRQYLMNSKSGDSNEVKIGSRVPVEVKQGEFQYMDVGTSIWCNLRDQSDFASLGGDVMLKVRAEVSNFALPEQQGQQVRPVLRQLKIETSTIGMPGKPLNLGSVDDPGSKRQFQFEVTVTKLK